MAVIWIAGEEAELYYDRVAPPEADRACSMCSDPLLPPYLITETGYLRLHAVCALVHIHRLVEGLQELSGDWQSAIRERMRASLGIFGAREIASRREWHCWHALKHRREFGLAQVSAWLESAVELQEWHSEEERKVAAEGLLRGLVFRKHVLDLGEDRYQCWGDGPSLLLASATSPGDIVPPLRSDQGPRLDPQRNFSGDQKKEIRLRSNGHCVGCGCQLDSDWHADHIVPHSRGGKTEVINGQALCQPCNSRKSAKVLTIGEG